MKLKFNCAIDKNWYLECLARAVHEFVKSSVDVEYSNNLFTSDVVREAASGGLYEVLEEYLANWISDSKATSEKYLTVEFDIDNSVAKVIPHDEI